MRAKSEKKYKPFLKGEEKITIKNTNKTKLKYKSNLEVNKIAVKTESEIEDMSNLQPDEKGHLKFAEKTKNEIAFKPNLYLEEKPQLKKLKQIQFEKESIFKYNKRNKTKL